MIKVAIFGVPRSGTSWLAHIFNSHPDVALRFQPLFSYGHKNGLSEKSSVKEIKLFFNEIYNTKDPFALMATDHQKNYPVFDKNKSPTHLVFKETRYLNVIENLLLKCNTIRIIGLVRNPLAVLASWASAPKEFNPSWDLLEEWREAPSKNLGRAEEFFGYYKWKESANAFLAYQKRFPQQFILIRYNELNTSSIETAKKIFYFCQLDVEQQVTDFIFYSKSRHDSDPYSIYRSKADDLKWQNTLPQELINSVIRDLQDTPLEMFLNY